MSLLAKFNAVKVTADSRITAADRAFCEAHQAAYDAACVSLRDLAEMAEKAEAVQKKIMQPLEEEATRMYYHSYFAPSGTHFGASDFFERLEHIHGDFITHVAEHFKRQYGVSISVEELKEALIPQAPGHCGYWRTEAEIEEYQKFTEKLHAMSLRWEDIVDRIFVQIGGFSFAAQAEKELKEKCHTAAWNVYRHQPVYTVKSRVIRFTNVCHNSSYSIYSNEAELYEDGKSIVRALSHFENGDAGSCIHQLEEYVGFKFERGDKEHPIDCEKLSGIKFFKNGRMDVRFKSEALARQFVEEYCGLVE